MGKVIIIDGNLFDEKYYSASRRPITKLLVDSLTGYDRAFEVEVVQDESAAWKEVERGGVEAVIFITTGNPDTLFSAELFKERFPGVRVVVLTSWVPHSSAPPRIIALKENWVTTDLIREAVFHL